MGMKRRQFSFHVDVTVDDTGGYELFGQPDYICCRKNEEKMKECLLAHLAFTLDEYVFGKDKKVTANYRKFRKEMKKRILDAVEVRDAYPPVHWLWKDGEIGTTFCGIKMKNSKIHDRSNGPSGYEGYVCCDESIADVTCKNCLKKFAKRTAGINRGCETCIDEHNECGELTEIDCFWRLKLGQEDEKKAYKHWRPKPWMLELSKEEIPIIMNVAKIMSSDASGNDKLVALLNADAQCAEIEKAQIKKLRRDSSDSIKAIIRAANKDNTSKIDTHDPFSRKKIKVRIKND